MPPRRLRGHGKDGRRKSSKNEKARTNGAARGQDMRKVKFEKQPLNAAAPPPFQYTSEHRPTGCPEG